MPWNGTQLWVGEFTGAGVENPTLVAGGPSESGSSRNGRPRRSISFPIARGGGTSIERKRAAPASMSARAAEFGRPQWNFRMSTYAFLSANEAVCTYIEGGQGKLALWTSPAAS
jgi:hypothetical protein